MRSARSLLFVAVFILGAMVLLSWSQNWFVLTLLGLSEQVEVSGSVAAGPLAVLALCAWASLAALALAGKFFRSVIGVLLALLGVCVLAVSIFALSDVPRASFSVITEVTRLSGAKSLAELVVSVQPSFWPWLAVCAGVLLVTLGMVVSFFAPRLPASGSRFALTRMVAVDDLAKNPSVAWDALSQGDDPTETK